MPTHTLRLFVWSAFIDFRLKGVRLQTCGHCHFFKLQTGFELRDFVRHDILVERQAVRRRTPMRSRETYDCTSTGVAQHKAFSWLQLVSKNARQWWGIASEHSTLGA